MTTTHALALALLQPPGLTNYFAILQAGANLAARMEAQQRAFLALTAPAPPLWLQPTLPVWVLPTLPPPYFITTSKDNTDRAH